MLYLLLAACGEGAMIFLLALMFLPGMSLGEGLAPYIGSDWAGICVLVFDLLLFGGVITLGRYLFLQLKRKEMTEEQRQDTDRRAAARVEFRAASRRRHSDWRKESRQKKRDFKKWQAENRAQKPRLRS